ncbi:RNA-directed DNA polymerase, eukaryota, reverse transcriptase zinc-binding domain protein [Tanacetum coccineum]
MEGLHVAMEDAVEHCIFHDIRVGPGEALTFHLFYADDAMFMGEWDAENVSNLITILNCFYLVSGLCINLHKSKLYRVGVSSDDVKEFSGNAGCSAASLPFTYIGLPVGCNMRRISSWEDMILKVQKKLSTWKIKLLSIGGRLTLIKSVLGSLGVYFMSMFKMPEVVNKKMKALRAQFLWGGDDVDRKIAWVQWSQVLNSKENDDLSIGSLKALNLALIQKWRWRFHTDKRGIWNKIILSIYEQQRGFGSIGSHMHGSIYWSENEDVWRWEFDHEGEYSRMEDKNGSVSTLEKLDQKGIDLSSLLCPVCNTYIEDVNHVFVTCDLASQIWDRIFRWLDMAQLVFLSIADIIDWIISMHCSLKCKKLLEAIILTSMWVIWKYQNNTLFGSVKMKRSSIFDVIVSNAFEWCSSKSRYCSRNWSLWLQNPMLYIL